jgi:membrane protease YdiL (CAAX protease family)
LLLGVFRLAGFGWSDAGLGRAGLARGARWALVLVTLVAVGCVVGALLPVTRGVFLDRRGEQVGVGSAACQVLVRIPVGTVVLEEVAFRGVLYGLLRPDGIACAIAVSSWLFGLWHVLPARELPKLNPAVGRMFDTRLPLVVAAAVIATALAGVVLCELRRRSGSLLAPIGVHWAINALGFVTALVVTRWRGGM